MMLEGAQGIRSTVAIFLIAVGILALLQIYLGTFKPYQEARDFTAAMITIYGLLYTINHSNRWNYKRIWNKESTSFSYEEKPKESAEDEFKRRISLNKGYLMIAFAAFVQLFRFIEWST